MVGHLERVGVRDIFIDGSFVEDKPQPNDIDGYFVCAREFYISGALEGQLQSLDSVWTWDANRRYPSAGGAKRQLPMWHRYHVELFPHVGQFTGIRDAFGNEMLFPSALRQTRNFEPKGIVTGPNHLTPGGDNSTFSRYWRLRPALRRLFLAPSFTLLSRRSRPRAIRRNTARFWWP